MLSGSMCNKMARQVEVRGKMDELTGKRKLLRKLRWGVSGRGRPGAARNNPKRHRLVGATQHLSLG